MQHIVILSSLCKWKLPKMVVLLLNGTLYARPKNGGTQYARPNRAVRSTQGGVTLIRVLKLERYTYCIGKINIQLM